MAMCPALFEGHDAYMKKVKAVVDELGQHADDFDGIIASGMSGLMIAAPVSLKLGKTLGVVRHTDEKRHPNQHAGLVLIEKACFLDDFFGAGRTFRHCYEALKYADTPTRLKEADLTYYMENYGEEWVRMHYPESLLPPVQRNIVAIYTYDKAYGEKQHYVHVTSEAAVDLNRYKLWPTEVFNELRDGEKPAKKAVKRIVKKAAPSKRKLVKA